MFVQMRPHRAEEDLKAQEQRGF